jgi:TonB family protein
LAYQQTVSSAANQGGISFNTYDWDFAPYLIRLKKRIERNIYPPPAFTHLGIGGSNIIRFRISRDGTVTGPEVLGSEGEKALIETSKRAVEVSAPFWPLPEDFPRDYLEVTAKFFYVVNETS